MLDPLSTESPEMATVPGTGKTRRSYPKELKATIVYECLSGVRSVASIAMEHGINANLVHKWICLSRENPQPEWCRCRHLWLRNWRQTVAT